MTVRIWGNPRTTSNLNCLFWCFERNPLRTAFACKFADWFSSVFNCCECTAAYSAIKSTVLASKQIKKSWHWRSKTLHTCSYSGPGISKKSKESKLRAYTKAKDTNLMVNCICDQILSEMKKLFCRNINHKN